MAADSLDGPSLGYSCQSIIPWAIRRRAMLGTKGTLTDDGNLKGNALLVVVETGAEAKPMTVVQG